VLTPQLFKKTKLRKEMALEKAVQTKRRGRGRQKKGGVWRAVAGRSRSIRGKRILFAEITAARKREKSREGTGAVDQGWSMTRWGGLDRGKTARKIRECDRKERRNGAAVPETLGLVPGVRRIKRTASGSQV